jgi:hypothetical protein
LQNGSAVSALKFYHIETVEMLHRKHRFCY